VGVDRKIDLTDIDGSMRGLVLLGAEYLPAWFNTPINMILRHARFATTVLL
jgi:hypothetical protein